MKACPHCGSNDAPAVMSNKEIDSHCCEDCCQGCCCECGRDEEYTVLCRWNEGGCGASGGYRKTKNAAVRAWANGSRRQT